jgi:restriction system protein
MAIPSFHELIPSVMRALASGDQAGLDEMEVQAAVDFQLTEEDKDALLPSGQQRVLRNRVGWAKWYLEEAGYVETVRRGRYRLTEKGVSALKDPRAIVSGVLQIRKDKYQQNKGSNSSDTSALPDESQEVTPEEAIERAHLTLRNGLSEQLISGIKLASPRFFEELVVKLLLKMGYGGSRQEAGRAVGRSGDGGIDGIINEDRLGLDAIYVQAKRWEGVVGRPEIMKFVGALAGQRASKGVFITSSWFTQEAKDYANSSQDKVVLLDGSRLAELMIEHDLGVAVAATYQLKRIDTDFFADE